MAVKTFTTGEVLTAADTNTYLANAGLDYIKTVTIGTGVTSITVSDAFSSTWDNYRVVIANADASSADGNYYIRFETAPLSTYNWGTTYISYGGTAGNGNQANSNGGIIAGVTSSDNDTSSVMDIYGPNKAQFTHVTTQTSSTSYQLVGGGVMKTATAYTAFYILSANALTGGTITVYGYRKA